MLNFSNSSDTYTIAKGLFVSRTGPVGSLGMLLLLSPGRALWLYPASEKTVCIQTTSDFKMQSLHIAGNLQNARYSTAQPSFKLGHSHRTWTQPTNQIAPGSLHQKIVMGRSKDNRNPFQKGWQQLDSRQWATLDLHSMSRIGGWAAQGVLCPGPSSQG